MVTITKTDYNCLNYTTILVSIPEGYHLVPDPSSDQSPETPTYYNIVYNESYNTSGASLVTTSVPSRVNNQTQAIPETIVSGTNENYVDWQNALNITKSALFIPEVVQTVTASTTPTGRHSTTSTASSRVETMPELTPAAATSWATSPNVAPNSSVNSPSKARPKTWKNPDSPPDNTTPVALIHPTIQPQPSDSDSEVITIDDDDDIEIVGITNIQNESTRSIITLVWLAVQPDTKQAELSARNQAGTNSHPIQIDDMEVDMDKITYDDDLSELLDSPPLSPEKDKHPYSDHSPTIGLDNNDESFHYIAPPATPNTLDHLMANKSPTPSDPWEIIMDGDTIKLI